MWLWFLHSNERLHLLSRVSCPFTGSDVWPKFLLQAVTCGLIPFPIAGSDARRSFLLQAVMHGSTSFCRQHPFFKTQLWIALQEHGAVLRMDARWLENKRCSTRLVTSGSKLIYDLTANAEDDRLAAARRHEEAMRIAEERHREQLRCLADLKAVAASATKDSEGAPELQAALAAKDARIEELENQVSSLQAAASQRPQAVARPRPCPMGVNVHEGADGPPRATRSAQPGKGPSCSAHDTFKSLPLHLLLQARNRGEQLALPLRERAVLWPQRHADAVALACPPRRPCLCHGVILCCADAVALACPPRRPCLCHGVILCCADAVALACPPRRLCFFHGVISCCSLPALHACCRC